MNICLFFRKIIMSKYTKTVMYILLVLILFFWMGFLSQYFQADAISSWYPLLNKPSITPPNYVFPIAWGIIYVCMSISIGLFLWMKNMKKTKILTLFIIQFLLNFVRSLTFFYFQNILLGLIILVILDIIVISYMIGIYRKNKISSLLTIPYVLRLCFATYLNVFILLNN